MHHLKEVRMPKADTIRLSIGRKRVLIPKSVRFDEPDFRLLHNNPFLDKENPLHQMCNDVMTLFSGGHGHHAVCVVRHF